MSIPILPWVIRPIGTLVVECFCHYGINCRFFTVDSLAWPTGSFLLLRASYMTCTHCGEIDLSPVRRCSCRLLDTPSTT